MCCKMVLCRSNIFAKTVSKVIIGLSPLPMKKITRSRLLGLFFALFATSAATAQTTPTITSWGAPSTSEYAYHWFEWFNWTNSFADGQGSVGWFNLDINPWISISDHFQAVTGTGSATVPQVIALEKLPTNNSVSVTDGSFYWSQSKGSNSTAFIVNYSPLTNSVSILYNPGVGSGRKLRVSYATPMPADAKQLIASTDNVNRVFSKKISAPLAYNSSFFVTDDVYNWTANSNGGGTTTKQDTSGDLITVNSSEFDVQYDPLALTITVTYGTVFGSVGHNGGPGVPFQARQIKANYQTKGSGAVTLGTLGLGDPGQNQGLGESYNLRMNSLTFDNNGAMSNIIKVNGFAGDEIASGMHLTGPLAVAVRTGGDVTNSLRLAGNIDGLGGLVKADSGNLTITGNNTFSGPMIIRDTAGTTFLRSGVTLLNCVTQVGSSLVTCNSTSGLEVGMSISGPNIQPGTVVTAVDPNGTSFTISPIALANASNQTLVAKTTSGVLVRNAVTTANSRLVTIPADPPVPQLSTDLNTYSTSNTNGLAVGMALSGTGMAPDAFVAAITGRKSFIMTTGATATSGVNGVTLVADAGSFKLAKTTITGVRITEGTATVLCDDTSTLVVGMTIAGADAASIAAMPAYAVVTSIIDSTHFTISPAAPNPNGGSPRTIEGLTLVGAVTGNSLVTGNVTPPTITLAPVPLVTKVLDGCVVKTSTTSISCPTTAGLVVGMSVTADGNLLKPNTTIASIVDLTHFTVNVLPQGTAPSAIVRVGTATTNGSATVVTASTAGLIKGMSITGDNIQPDSVINTIVDSIRFTLNKTATGTGSGISAFAGYATTAGSKNLIAYSTAGLTAGQTITATGPSTGYIVPGTKIASLVAATSFSPPIVVLDTNAAVTGSGLTLKVGSVVKSGSPTVTVASTTGLTAGMIVRGPGIPDGTVITSVVDAFSFVMSRPATANGTIVQVVAAPAPGLSMAGLSTTAGSTTITSSTAGAVIPGLSGLSVGTLITGVANIPDNSVVTSIASDFKSFTISAPALGSGTTTDQLLTAMTSRGITLTGCSIAAGTRVVTCDITTGLVVGSLVSGVGMPDNAVVTAVNSATQFTISSNATVTVPSSTPVVLTATAGGYALSNFGQSVAGATTVVNSPIVTVTNTALLRVGMVVTGANIPARAVIVSITDATTIVLSTNATATGAVPNMLAADPRVLGVAVTDATTTPGSNTITLTGSGTSITTGLQVGQLITGTSPFIPQNAIITAKTANTITISMPAGGAAVQSGLTLLATTPPGLPLLGAATQANSATVTVASTTGLAPGMLLTGQNLPTNSVIVDVVNATQVVISSRAAATGTGLTLLASSTATQPIYNAQTTAGSNMVEVDSIGGLTVGLPVTGDGIPAGATITQFNGPTGAPNNRANSFTISTNATASATGLTLMATVPLMNADVVVTNAVTMNKNRAIFCDSTAGMIVGMAVVGPNMPNGATVSAIPSSRIFLINLPALADGWGLTLGVGANAISSSTLVLGTANRDGNSSAVLQLSAPNQINDDAVIQFDGASSRNP
ncbi:MAG: hypothetical protein JWO89_3603, partial [Verrucomicrobiaceae bacterium]|nr:hypothetical protein [Verrucomicrobiaceae bacterium]